MSRPEVTVVIPTWNRRELLEHCLDSLKVQTVPCEIIVVDNGSTDGSAEVVRERFPDATLLEMDQNLGFAKAVNHGIRSVTTPYLALLNNDTEVAANWIEEGLAAFTAFPECGFFASRMVDFHDRTMLDSAGDCYSRSGMPTKRGFGEPVSRYMEPCEVLGASAGAAFYRRELFDNAGLLDEGYFMYLEDVDLSLRSQLLGYRCRYLPEAVVYHIEAASDAARTEHKAAEGLPKRSFYSSGRVYWITRNRWQLMISYQPLRNVPWLLAGWARSFLFHALKAGFLWDFIRGLYGGIVLTGVAYRKRGQIKKRAVLTTRGLCQLLRKC